MEVQTPNPPQEDTQLAEPTENLKRLHKNLTEKWDGFNVPFDVFMEDMKDEQKRLSLHKNLSDKWDGFSVPFDQFTVDLIGGVDKKKDPSIPGEVSGDGSQPTATSASEEQVASEQETRYQQYLDRVKDQEPLMTQGQMQEEMAQTGRQEEIEKVGSKNMQPVIDVALQKQQEKKERVDKAKRVAEAGGDPVKYLAEVAKDVIWETGAYTIPAAIASTGANLISLEDKIKSKIYDAIGSSGMKGMGDASKLINNETKKDLLKWSEKKKKEGSKIVEGITREVSKVSSPLGAIEYVTQAAAQSIPQIAAAYATSGLTAVPQEIGNIYFESVEQIAKDKKITIDEVIDKGLDQPAVAFTTGIAAAYLDKLSANEVMSPSLKDGLATELRAKAKAIGKSVGQSMASEAATETGQTWIEELGKYYGAGYNFEESLNKAAENPSKYLDAALGGALGAGPLSVVSQVYNSSEITDQSNEGGVASTPEELQKTIDALEAANDPKNQQAIDLLNKKLDEAIELEKINAESELSENNNQDTEQQPELPAPAPTPPKDPQGDGGAQPEVVEEIEPIKPTGIKLSDAPNFDKPLVLNGESGVIREEGQQLVFESPSRIYELGNKDEVAGKDLSELGIEVEQELGIEVQDDFSVTYNGKTYVNQYSDPLSAINKNDDGEVVSVTLDTEDGKKRTIRGQAAQEIAYNYLLNNFEKNATEEQRQAIEQRISEAETQQTPTEEKNRITGTGYTLSSEEQRQLAEETVLDTIDTTGELVNDDPEYTKAINQRYESPTELQFPETSQISGDKTVKASEVFGVESDQEITTKTAMKMVRKRHNQYKKLLDCLKNG